MKNSLSLLIVLMFSVLLVSLSSLEKEELNRLKLLLKAKEQQVFRLKNKVASFQQLRTNYFPNVRFGIYVNQTKAPIFRGEEFETEFGLKILDGIKIIKIKVNGDDLAVKEGKAVLKRTTTAIGEKKYDIQFIIENTITKDLDTLYKEFMFEVESKKVAIASKNNRILYTFRENEINIASNECSSWKLYPRVCYGSESNGRNSIRTGRLAGGRYYIKPSRADTTVTVQLVNRLSGEKVGDPVTFYTRKIKEIPTYLRLSEPISDKRVKTIKVEEMRKQTELNSGFNKYEFDAICNVWTYKLRYYPKNGKSQTYFGERGTFEGEILERIQNAEPGDRFSFYDIKSLCPAANNAFNKTYSVVYNVL